jgi:hypothetical protein
MKKIVALVAVLFSVVVPVQSQAADSKALVIIDSYFDSRVTGAEVVCRQNLDCSVTSLPVSTSLSSPINHGVGMVEVAKRQSASIKIIALRSATATKKSANELNAGDFIEALTWVNNNSSRVGAVSVSRYFNGTKPCSPSSTGTAPYGGVALADAKIKSLISSLKAKGIPVFASTGNTFGKAVDYPACILETNSVSTGDYNKSNVLVSANAFDSNTDFFATSTVYNYSSSVFGLLPQTTSSATAAVAAQYVAGNQLTKIVQVIR